MYNAFSVYKLHIRFDTRYAVWISCRANVASKSNLIQLGSAHEWSGVWTGPQYTKHNLSSCGWLQMLLCNSHAANCGTITALLFFFFLLWSFFANAFVKEVAICIWGNTKRCVYQIESNDENSIFLQDTWVRSALFKRVTGACMDVVTEANMANHAPAITDGWTRAPSLALIPLMGPARRLGTV